MLDVALTVFAGARTNVPYDRTVLTWDALCDEITALCSEESEATDKRDLPAFGPYRLRAGAVRSAAAVEAMSAVAVLDLDEGLDFEALRARLRDLKCAAIVHGSPSDGTNCTRKVRVYVALDSEHAPSDSGRVRDSVAALLGVTACPSARDAARLCFCGRLAGTPPRYVERFDGGPVALATLPAVDPPKAAAVISPTVACEAAAVRGGSVVHAVALSAMLASLPPWPDCAGSKHAICGAIGGMLRKAGFARDDCAELVRGWLPANEPGVNVGEGVRWACTAWSKSADEVSGEAALAGLIGADRCALFAQGALIPWRARFELPAVDGSTTSVVEYAGLREVNRALPPPVLNYVIPDLGIAPGKVTAIQGFANTAKTPWALLMSVCIATGRDFLGMHVRQGPVAYLDFEGGALTEERDARICAGLGLNRASVPLHFFHGEAAFSEAMANDIERMVCDRGIVTLFVDTYSSALPTDLPTFNEAAFRIWATWLGRLSDRTGVCVIILVHENKTARGGDGLRGISGHGSLAGGLQAAIALDRPNESEPNVIEVKCVRATKKAFKTFAVRWEDVDCPDAPGGQSLVAVRVEAKVKPKKGAIAGNSTRKAEHLARTRLSGERVMAMMLKAPDTALSAREMRERAGDGRNATNEAVARLVDGGLLVLLGDHYRLTEGGKLADASVIAKALGEQAPGFRR